MFLLQRAPVLTLPLDYVSQSLANRPYRYASSVGEGDSTILKVWRGLSFGGCRGRQEPEVREDFLEYSVVGEIIPPEKFRAVIGSLTRSARTLIVALAGVLSHD